MRERESIRLPLPRASAGEGWGGGNGVILFRPPEHVHSEMDNLIRMHGEHAAKNIAPEVSAAWLHHRFIQIHPFQDGNGRVARSLASLVFIRAGGFPMTIRDADNEREKYIDSLEAADKGNLQPFISICAECQKRTCAKAANAANTAN